jgi:hypothetical protein
MKRAIPQRPATALREIRASSGLLLVLLLGSASTAVAVDFSGSALVAATATDNRGIESDLLEQRYQFRLFQQLTPYLSAGFGYQFLDLTSTLAEGVDFTRRTQRPLLELRYNRNRLSGRLAVYDQLIENTSQAEDLERRSLAAYLGWRPTLGPAFSVNFLQDRNIADVSVFGRGNDSRLLELVALYNRKNWAAGYSFVQRVLENPSNQLRTDQNRHEFHGNASRYFLGSRLFLGLSGRLSRLNRTSRLGEDTELAEPIPAAEGLVAVDTSPAIGELLPNTTLNDGDVETPASPPIEIGGANTFRNIGVDLGITRPVSRLEIAVDTVSGPQVAWQVFRSRDNLVWELIPGVTATFDEALLRYELRIPETEDRFFKAVNVSTNPVPIVLVTEARALLDLDAEQVAEDTESTLYRADVLARFHPSSRISGAVGFGLSNDENFSAGLVRRNFSEVHANARLSFDLRQDLRLNLGYNYTDSEELRDPILLRTVNRFNVALNWYPLPTVDAVLSAGRRDESEAGEPIQTLDSVRLGVATDLLPDLRLVSDLNLSRLDDPFAGRDRNSLTWRENLQMQLLPTWTLGGIFSYSLNKTREGDALLRRTQIVINTTWTATRYLVLGGFWFWSDDDGRNSINQSYNISYTPGDKLTLSATYRGFDSSTGVGTSGDSVNVTYRLYRRFILFANLSRSRSEVTGGESTEISSLRAGLRLSF